MENIAHKTFTVDMYNQNAYNRCMEFIVAKNFKAKRNILGIFGLENVGKTRLLKVMEDCLVQNNIDVRFVSASELVDKISAAKKSRDIFLWKIKKEFKKCTKL